MIMRRGSSDDLLILVTGGRQRVQKLSDLAIRPDFRMGPVSISPARRLVDGPAGQTHLEPIIMQVFLMMVDARGQVVTRTELFDQCWGRSIVGDDSLNRAMARVRRVALDTAPDLFEIETIPRTGYRLIGDILSFDRVSDEPATGASRVSRRLAIAGGAAVAGLAGAGVWLAGRERPDPRFTQLVARADQVLRYNLPGSSAKAAELLREAVRIEPGNVRAAGLLAYALANIADNPPVSDTGIAASEDAIRLALKLDPRESNAMLARYMVKNSLRDWMETDLHLREILEVDPRNTFAMNRLVALLQAAGLNEESWDWNERAIAIDPVAPVHQYRRSLKHWIFGRIQSADVTIDRTMQLWPHHAWVWNARFLIYAFTDRTSAALEILNDDQVRPSTVTENAILTWRTSLAALDERSPARIAAARKSVLAAARDGPGLAAYGAMTLSELGELDAAFDVINGVLLARGTLIQRRSDDPRGFSSSAGWRYTQWLFTPPMRRLHADPRFVQLCEAIGLSDYWARRGVKPSYLAQRR